MNAPFPSGIEPILAELCIGISGLKKNPASVIAAAQSGQVAILNRNRPVAYMISPEVWEHLCELLEDVRDARLVRERLAQEDEEVEVSLDEL